MIRVNRRSLERRVYALSTLDGHLTPMFAQRAPVALANRPGVFGTSVTVTPRVTTVGLDVRPESFVGRQAFFDSLRREYAGLLELESDDLPGRVCYAVMETPTVELYPGSFLQRACWVELRFVAQDPARWDLEPQLFGLSTTARTPCPVGTETSDPTITIVGACTNPAIVVRNARGAEVSRTQFTVTMAANDALQLVCATEQITRTVAGVVQTGAASGLAAYTSGPLPLLAPEDGSVDGAVPPTVELVAASGTPTGTIEYRRRW